LLSPRLLFLTCSVSFSHMPRPPCVSGDSQAYRNSAKYEIFRASQEFGIASRAQYLRLCPQPWSCDQGRCALGKLRKEIHMNRSIVIAAAAALTVGGLQFVRAADEGVGQKISNSVSNATTKMGIGSVDKASEHQTKHAEEIHDVIAQVAEKAVSKDNLKD